MVCNQVAELYFNHIHTKERFQWTSKIRLFFSGFIYYLFSLRTRDIHEVHPMRSRNIHEVHPMRSRNITRSASYEVTQYTRSAYFDVTGYTRRAYLEVRGVTSRYYIDICATCIDCITPWFKSKTSPPLLRILLRTAIFFFTFCL